MWTDKLETVRKAPNLKEGKTQKQVKSSRKSIQYITGSYIAKRDKVWNFIKLVISMWYLFYIVECATYLYRFWAPHRREGRRNGVSSASPPHWTFRGQTSQVLENTWGHSEEESPVWAHEFLSPKQYQFLEFYMAANTGGLTSKLADVCGEFLK